MRPTREEILSLYLFDEETGTFRHKPRPGVRAGKIAGFCHGGKDEYWGICVNNKRYMAHILVWFLIHGEWPESDIDHKDRNKRNNAPSNLRLATRAQNNANAALQKNNTSGFRGVCFDKRTGKWRAQIMINRKARNLGLFSDKDKAARVYSAEAKRVWGDYVNV